MLGCHKHFHMTASTRNVCPELDNTVLGSWALPCLSEFMMNTQGLDCYCTSLKMAIVKICERRLAAHLRRPFDPALVDET
jgi:hypothetical protein